jgi:DNA-binding MarR family transcriptional regulator
MLSLFYPVENCCMEIGREIKQERFKNEHQKMLINIFFTSSWLSSKHSCTLKPYGISVQQYNILRILRGQHPNPVTINLLIDRMLDKNSNASRLVEKLRLKKLVERAVSLDDRRAVNVVITQKGLSLLTELDKQEELFLKDLKNLSAKEAELVSNLLDKLRD